MRGFLSALLAGALVWLGPVPLAAQQSPAPDSTAIERLASLGRLWGTVNYFHPDLAFRRVNWDSAVVATVPKVRGAANAAAFALALDSLLQVLNDPLTRASRETVRAAPATEAARAWQPDSVLLVQIGDVTVQAATKALHDAAGDIEKASRIVFDLRTGRVTPRPRHGRMTEAFDGAEITSRLITRRTPGPVRRFRSYSGFPDERWPGPYYYWPGMMTAGITAPLDAQAPRPRAIVWLVDDGTDVPMVALATRAAGSAHILKVGSSPKLGGVGVPHRLRLADNVTASVRIADLVAPDGAEIRATRLLPDSPPGDTGPLGVAMSLAVAPPSIPTDGEVPSFSPVGNRAYGDMAYPPAEYRLLGAFRLWNAIEYFYPYKRLMGEDWNAALRTAIVEFLAASDSLEYAQAVARFASRIHDSHTFVDSKALLAFFGEAPPAARARFVEGKLVVTAVASDPAEAGGLRVGDVITSVDGQRIEKRRDLLSPFFPHSTPAALDRKLANWILNGPSGSSARLQVVDGKGRDTIVTVSRRLEYRQQMRWSRPGPPWRLLEGNIGYVDLERLAPAMVDSMFNGLRAAKAIIFDGRGYPQNTVWTIASRLTDKRDVVEALFKRPVVMSPDTAEWHTDTWAQHFSASAPRYGGKTVLLVDERTISLGEHTGLLFKAANQTTIIGSETMGANGDVTHVVLPGGIFVGFTGQAVTWPDGRQLQRVGLRPDIVVRPSIAGIRAGNDEVLQRAVRFVNSR